MHEKSAGTIQDELAYAGMVGDVNLYLNDADEPNTGEIEVILSICV